jgi:hypothetical protein
MHNLMLLSACLLTSQCADACIVSSSCQDALRTIATRTMTCSSWERDLIVLRHNRKQLQRHNKLHSRARKESDQTLIKSEVEGASKCMHFLRLHSAQKLLSPAVKQLCCPLLHTILSTTATTPVVVLIVLCTCVTSLYVCRLMVHVLLALLQLLLLPTRRDPLSSTGVAVDWTHFTGH